MLISTLIARLRHIENTWTEEDEKWLGPPQISFDVFRPKYPGSPNIDRVWGGICDNDVVIEYTERWPYPVIATFAEYYEDPSKTKEQAEESRRASVAWPESWEA